MKKLFRFYLAFKWRKKREVIFASVQHKTLEFRAEQYKGIEIMLYKNVQLIEKLTNILRTSL